MKIRADDKAASAELDVAITDLEAALFRVR